MSPNLDYSRDIKQWPLIWVIHRKLGCVANFGLYICYQGKLSNVPKFGLLLLNELYVSEWKYVIYVHA